MVIARAGVSSRIGDGEVQVSGSKRPLIERAERAYSSGWASRGRAVSIVVGSGETHGAYAMPRSPLASRVPYSGALRTCNIPPKR